MSIPRQSSPTSWLRTGPRPGIWASPNATDLAGCERQSGGKLASADAKAGAEAAEIQVQGLGSEIPRHPHRRLQRLQSPASSDPPTNPPPVPGRGPSDVGGGNRRCVITPTGRGPPQFRGVKLTELLRPLAGCMAVRVGFEPTLGFHLNTLSKRAPSTTRPPHHCTPRGAGPGGRRAI